jgi:hypothetical protein
VLNVAKSDDLTSYLVCMIDVDLCLMLAEVKKYAVSYIWSPKKKKVTSGDFVLLTIISFFVQMLFFLFPSATRQHSMS